jgi:putative Mg2+ transporter-C (MgtC) family protein
MTLPLGDWEMTERLLLAALIGALLGIEREWRQKTAGLRTNVLIAVGTTTFTLMSIEFANGVPAADPGRLAAQILTGVGFLGAGAIMRTDSGIHGLTTAATVWVNAALSVAIGGGEYHLAIIGSVVTLSALVVLQPIEIALEKRIRRAHDRGTTTATTDAGPSEASA